MYKSPETLLPVEYLLGHRVNEQTLQKVTMGRETRAHGRAGSQSSSQKRHIALQRPAPTGGEVGSSLGIQRRLWTSLGCTTWLIVNQILIKPEHLWGWGWHRDSLYIAVRENPTACSLLTCLLGLGTHPSWGMAACPLEVNHGLAFHGPV